MIFSKLLLLAMAGGLSVAADSQEPCQKITEIRDKATKTNCSKAFLRLMQKSSY